MPGSTDIAHSPRLTSRPSASTASTSAEPMSVGSQRMRSPASPLDRTADPTARSCWSRSSCTARAPERLSTGARYASSASGTRPHEAAAARALNPNVRSGPRRNGRGSTPRHRPASSGPGTSPCGWPAECPHRHRAHTPVPRRTSSGSVSPAVPGFPPGAALAAPGCRPGTPRQACPREVPAIQRPQPGGGRSAGKRPGQVGHSRTSRRRAFPKATPPPERRTAPSAACPR